MPPTLIVLLAGGAMLLLLGLARLVVQQLSPMPAQLGVRDGWLVDCPATPNCVSSQAPPADAVHRVEPLPYAADPAAAREQLLAVLDGLPRTRLIANEPRYVHAEVRSLVWGFVDDVEFFIDEPAGVVHVRSASRLGRGDMGVNRARAEAIRRAFNP